MGVGWWLTEGWGLYRENWGRMALGALIVELFFPLVIGFGIFRIFNIPLKFSKIPLELPAGELTGIIVLYSILHTIVGGMLLLGYSYYTLKLVRNEKPSAIRDFLRPFRQPLPVIGVIILYTLAVMIGLILLIIPGFIFAVKLYFADIALIDRNLTVGSSFGESLELTRGHGLSLFLLLLVFGIIESVLDFIGRAGGIGVGTTLAILSSLIVTPWWIASVMHVYNDLLENLYPPSELEGEGKSGPSTLPA